ncbi:MAG: ECF transporter S component [Clostridiales bacterium]|nr:ECF transporter S component [Clostridiales bacterium]
MTTALESRNARHKKILWLAETAMLAAIVILMSFTPIGYLRTAGVEITFIMIPVVIGSIIVGPTSGLVLGAVWGITSFIQCFGMSPFGAALLGINPVLTFIVCLVPRILAGWVSGLIFVGLSKLGKSGKYVGYPAASLSVALINTLLFVGSIILLFGNTEYIKSMQGDLNIFAFFVAFVGFNGLIEAITTFIVGGAISAGIGAALGKKRAK